MVTHFTASVRENNSTKMSLGNYTSSCGSLALCECLKTFQWVDSSLASLLVYFGTWNSSAYVHSNDATLVPRKRNCVKYYMDVLFTAFFGPGNWSHFFMSLTSSLVFFFSHSGNSTQHQRATKLWRADAATISHPGLHVILPLFCHLILLQYMSLRGQKRTTSLYFKEKVFLHELSLNRQVGPRQIPSHYPMGL